MKNIFDFKKFIGNRYKTEFINFEPTHDFKHVHLGFTNAFWMEKFSVENLLVSRWSIKLPPPEILDIAFAKFQSEGYKVTRAHHDAVSVRISNEQQEKDFIKHIKTLNDMIWADDFEQDVIAL